MKHSFNYIFTLVVGVLLLAGCHNVEIGDGNIIQNTTLKDSTNTIHFTEVEINTDCNVFVSQNNFTEVKITGYQNLVPNIVTMVESNQLKVTLLDGVVLNNNNVNVYITSPVYTKISLNSSASIYSTDSITSNKLEVVNNGSGSISLFGSVNLVDSYSASTGITRLCALAADTVNATMFGAGILSTKPVNKLNAHIPGSGQVQYIGNPTISFTLTGTGSLAQQPGCY